MDGLIQSYDIRKGKKKERKRGKKNAAE